MERNRIAVDAALNIDEKLTRHRQQKPFTHCGQCSKSHFVPKDPLSDSNEVVCVCKKPGRRPIVIDISDSIVGCVHAVRYTNEETLSAEVVRTIRNHKASLEGLITIDVSKDLQ